jgi:2-methylisocitrate lyase-like PEP mutase family enzyme
MSQAMPQVVSQAEKGAAFSALHQGEPFLIPNPWDAGSARVLEALGFRALATTSSGFAFTLGRRDGGATLDEVVGHVRSIAHATRIPVSVDLENGHGPAPQDAARAIVRVAEAGAVGGSIEDYDPVGRIYDRELAVERVAAASEAARRLGFPFALTARAENHVRGTPDLDDTIARLLAYESAGADVLYAPGLTTVEQIRSVCAAVHKPVNVLAVPGLSARTITDAGAQRISVGGRLTWAAFHALRTAAEAMRDRGSFTALDVPGPPADWLIG